MHTFDKITRIGLDVDGVLTNGFAKEFIEALNAWTGESFKWDDLTEYNMCKALGVGFDTPEVLAAFGEAAEDCRWYELEEWAEGFYERIAQEPNVEVYFITTPWEHGNTGAFAEARRLWLKHHFGVGMDRVIMTACKESTAGYLDLLIDDKPANVAAFRTQHNRTARYPAVESGFLWEQVYNRSFHGPCLRGGRYIAEEHIRFIRECKERWYDGEIS